MIIQNKGDRLLRNCVIYTGIKYLKHPIRLRYNATSDCKGKFRQLLKSALIEGLRSVSTFNDMMIIQSILIQPQKDHSFHGISSTFENSAITLLQRSVRATNPIIVPCCKCQSSAIMSTRNLTFFLQAVKLSGYANKYHGVLL